eukprot:6118842-Amphidinium_carterae.1
MLDTIAATSAAMEVDEGSPGVTSPGGTRSPELHWQLPRLEEQGAPNVTFAGASATADAGTSGVLAEVPAESAEPNASYIRQIAAQTLVLIKEQEAVLMDWTTCLSLMEEGTDNYKAMQSQIETSIEAGAPIRASPISFFSDKTVVCVKGLRSGCHAFGSRLSPSSRKTRRSQFSLPAGAMQKSCDPPGTRRNVSGRLIDERGKYMKDPNKLSTSTTRRASGKRSASASTPREERSRSPEQVADPEDQQRDNS